MQAHHAAGAVRMHITPEASVQSQERLRLMLRLFCACLAVIVIMGSGAAEGWSQRVQQKTHELELSRAVRPWEFLPITGTRAGLLGSESGRMEAWVYPLKIFREFHLKFHTEGRALAAEALARTVTVRPESATILYAGKRSAGGQHSLLPGGNQAGVLRLAEGQNKPWELKAL